MRFLFPGFVAAALLLGLTTAILLGETATSENLGGSRPAAPTSIQIHTEFLADDALEGREAGKQGGYAAATYIVEELTDHQIQSAGEDGGFFQPFGRGYRNILARIPGTAEATDEWIVLSAHYDHVGYGSRKVSNGPIGQIHNGADDNASGVAAILHVAGQLSALETPLKRSVLIVFWDAEEKGLLGSKHWLKNPTLDTDKIKLMINVDMIGRLRQDLSLYGTRTMPGLRQAWSEANSEIGLKLDFPWEVVNNSDHFEFYKRRIPITMVHTGLHDDYHRPSDDVHLLNQDGIEMTAQLLLDMLKHVGGQETLPGFRRESFFEGSNEQKYFERPYAQQQRRLGLTIRTRSRRARQIGGIEVGSVWSGSPASRAGLSTGDLILEANGHPISSVEVLRGFILRAKERLLLTVKSEADEQRYVEVSLAGKPQKVGLSWRTNDAEPNVVVLSGVVDDSPADAAGLKAQDRILEVDGEKVIDSETFRTKITNLTSDIELLIERKGQIERVTLQVPVAATE